MFSAWPPLGKGAYEVNRISKEVNEVLSSITYFTNTVILQVKDGYGSERKYAKRGSKNAERGFIPNRVDIDEREQVVELKERFGDLETDTIIGKNHKGAILTINDRATSRVWTHKLTGKEAVPAAKITAWALRKVKSLIHTITADNGKSLQNTRK